MVQISGAMILIVTELLHVPSFIKDDLVPEGPRVSARPQTVMSRAKHSSVQSLRRVRLFGTHEPQQARLPCSSPSPGVPPNPCPRSQ